MMTSLTKKDFALKYAAMGWPVLPLHHLVDGQCSCRNPDCHSPGKHPRTGDGLKSASCDESVITQWWSDHPEANIGLRTGAKPDGAGVLVVDIDLGHDGPASLEELERQYGTLPDTVQARSGSGGSHYFFRHPDSGSIPNRTSLRPGIDIRANNGYIIVAPSTHKSGGMYAWKAGHSPWELSLADAPDWLLRVIQKVDNRKKPDRENELGSAGRSATPLLPRPTTLHGLSSHCDDLFRRASDYARKAEPAEQGERNSRAFKLAGHLWSFVNERDERLHLNQVLSILSEWNNRNSEPLSPDELHEVVGSAAKNGTPREPHRISPRGRAALDVSSTAYVDFPLDTLPSPVRDVVGRAQISMGCDVAMLALPLLAGLASAIGNKRTICLKNGWSEPAILWTMVIADSGTLKTPAMDFVLKPVRKRQDGFLKIYDRSLEMHKLEDQMYQATRRSWKPNCDEPMPHPPKPPVAQRCWCNDTTVEALAVILKENWDGVLIAKDELSGWFTSFDRYTQAKGGDAARWLEMHGAKPLCIDRKTGDSKIIHVPRASVSITGGIQPGVLRDAMGAESLENGMAARLLMAKPPRRQKVWTESDIDPADEAILDQVYDKLYSIQPQRSGRDNEPSPISLTLSDEAKRVWVDFYNQNAATLAESAGVLASTWSKLEGYAARLALVIHLTKWACHAINPDSGHVASPVQIDEESMRCGVRLANWFGGEATRVYQDLAKGPEDRRQDAVLELIRRHGGKITARQLQQSSRGFSTAEEVEDYLNRLMQMGMGNWVSHPPGNKGGRPTRFFVLANNEGERNETLSVSQGCEGFVDVDAGRESPMPETDSVCDSSPEGMAA